MDLMVLLVSMHVDRFHLIPVLGRFERAVRAPSPVARDVRSSGPREPIWPRFCARVSHAWARFWHPKVGPLRGKRSGEVAYSRMGNFPERPPKPLVGSGFSRYSLGQRKGHPGRDGIGRVTRVTEEGPTSPITKRTRTYTPDSAQADCLVFARAD